VPEVILVRPDISGTIFMDSIDKIGRILHQPERVPAGFLIVIDLASTPVRGLRSSDLGF